MTESMDEAEIVSALQTIPLFAEMEYDQIMTLYNAGELRQVQPDEMLSEANTVDDRLTIFLRGRLRLESPQGSKLADLEPVRAVGEMGVFTGRSRSTHVIAEEDSLVMILAAEVWEDLWYSDPDIGSKLQVGLIKVLYDRIHDMNQELHALQEQVSRLQGNKEED